MMRVENTSESTSDDEGLATPNHQSGKASCEASGEALCSHGKQREVDQSCKVCKVLS